MSIHPSLSVSEKEKKQRSVLKRVERLRFMMEKGQWKDGDSVYTLPKIKSLKIKIKKEKAEKAPAAEGAAPVAAPAKGAAGKGQEKKQEKK